MKQNLSLEPSPFIVYRLTLKEQDRAALDGLLENYERHCLLSRMDAASLREDVERALLWYHSAGVPLEEAIARLSPIHLGGFYARPPVTWFPLDDAAKIYPLSMRPGKMAVFRLSIYLRQPVVPELPEELAAEVTHMDFVLGTALTNRASCSLVTCCGVATLSIAKMTADPSFEERLYALLCRDGIVPRVEGSDLHGH